MKTFWKKQILPFATCTLVGFINGCLLSVAVAEPDLSNGGFERADAQNLAQVAGWTIYGKGYQLDSQIRRGGKRSLRCVNPGGGQTFGAFVTYALNQTRALPISVTGWSKAQNVDGVADNDYSVYVDITYTDGSTLWGQTAPFETGSHDWQCGRVTIFPSKPVRSLNVYALMRNHAGTVWFDDFDVREITSNRLFDGQNIAPPVLSRNAKSGWFIRDVEANTPLHPLIPGKATLGVRFDLQLKTHGPVLRGTLRNLTPKSRAVTIYYVERFDAARPIWWNTIRDGVSATEIREYANLTQAGAGATGQLSQYPFGCVTGQKTGRALGVPPDLGPRVARIAFRPDTRLLFLSYDLALTGRGDTAHHDNAPVAVARYEVDPTWGFRDAAARFYALFPDAFQRRAKAEGIWMPFTNPANVVGMEDFHIAYHEGDNSVASDRQKGILSFKYVEPMTYWMPMAKGVPRTYSEATVLVRKIASGNDPVASHQAQSVLSSGSQDASGRLNVAFRNAPWCDGAVWVLNPNPRMGQATKLWTKARLNAAGKPVPGKPNQPDGEYLDSLEAWADVLDYRPESLRASTISLCFTPGRFRPTLPTWFSVYESTATLSRDLHRDGALLMANSVPWRFTAFAPLLDVMGTETNMFTETGAWSPETDAVMNLRRTMSYHKPYLLLLNTDFNKVDKEGIARYFERCAFYGIYPSMFSVNAADHPYWENPSLYNRDRPLFQKYIPTIQKLSAAGWEPVTWARSDSSAVWLERFGRTYITILNSDNTQRETTLHIDTAHFFPDAVRRGAKIVIHDLWTGQDVMTASPGASIPLRMTLAAQETRVLSLRLIDSKMATKGRNE